MSYRADIDGLRAISVLAVIFFHAGFGAIGGGFVGVDVFFVISGYLITGIICTEIDRGHFSSTNFYRRRIARILPSLLIVIIATLAAGFLLFDSRQFDTLGKEAAFASIGLSNILYSYGVDYFADDRLRPLMHTWSLGVEEQFYLVWPTILVFLYAWLRLPLLSFALPIFALSFGYSALFTASDPNSSYFLLQFRAHELLLGAITFEIERKWRPAEILSPRLVEAGALGAALTILVTFFTFDGGMEFPGYAALLPTGATALLIALGPATVVGRILSRFALPWLGKISYPLYLFHLPIIVFARVLLPWGGPVLWACLALGLGCALSTLIYRTVERPLRALAKQPTRPAWIAMGCTLSAVVVSAGIGMNIAKANGWPWRLAYLNQFAYLVTEQQKDVFAERFSVGYSVNEKQDIGRILFIGDSIMQQYVVPFIDTLGIPDKDVDVVSRGNCLLIKGLKSVEYVAGVSCSTLRRRLYQSGKTYDLVVMAHNWEGYLSGPDKKGTPEQKESYSIETLLEHLGLSLDILQKRSRQIIVLGWSPTVNITQKLTPNPFLRREEYLTALGNLEVVNKAEIRQGDMRMRQFLKTRASVRYIETSSLWCNRDLQDCHLHDGEISYFLDALHFGQNAIPRLRSEIKKAMQKPLMRKEAANASTE